MILLVRNQQTLLGGIQGQPVRKAEGRKLQRGELPSRLLHLARLGDDLQRSRTLVEKNMDVV